MINEILCQLQCQLEALGRNVPPESQEQVIHRHLEQAAHESVDRWAQKEKDRVSAHLRRKANERSESLKQCRAGAADVSSLIEDLVREQSTGV